MNEVLSQDEIDALLDGVDGGDLDLGEAEPQETGQVVNYDFANQRHLTAGRMPAFDKVNEEFVRNLRDTTKAMLRRTVNLDIREFKMINFSEYLAGLSLPSFMTITTMKPLRGNALIVMNSDLAFAMVENYYGGSGTEQPAYIERKLTATEIRVLTLLAQKTVKDLESAWAPVHSVKIVAEDFETNPQMVNIIGPTDSIVVSVIQFEIDGVHGELEVCTPVSMLEPIKTKLEKGGGAAIDDNDQGWKDALREQVGYVGLDLSGDLFSINLKLSEVKTLKKDDVIPIELPDYFRLYSGDVPLFDCKFGVSNEHCAAKIIRQVKV